MTGTPLTNGKWEKFAHLIVQGLKAGPAYAEAGYQSSSAAARDVCASRLLCSAKVRARIHELQAAIATRVLEKTAITEAMVLEELGKIGFANMTDYIKIGADGDPYTDFSGLTRAQAAAIGELTVEDFKDGRGDEGREVRRVKFKLLDKRGALVDIGKHLGMFKERVEHSGAVTLENLVAGSFAKPKSDE